MSQRKFEVESNTPYLVSVHKHLGHVRQWIQGFEAGSGKPGPAHTDALRRAQILIIDLMASKSK